MAAKGLMIRMLRFTALLFIGLMIGSLTIATMSLA